MTWTGVTQEEVLFAGQMVLWIRTARAAGHGDETWLPTSSDVLKSALFERIRSGKEPLPYPPPVAYSCPWYALVEDPGPHFVGSDVHAPGLPGSGVISIMQSGYRIVAQTSDHDLLVVDAHHLPQTPWKFRLWYDPDWQLPTLTAGSRSKGGWFMQNVIFANSEPEDTSRESA